MTILGANAKKARRRCAGPFRSVTSLLALRHDFFGGEFTVDHALDACDAVVFGDVDGPDALRVAAQRTDRFLLVVSMPISIAEIH